VQFIERFGPPVKYTGKCVNVSDGNRLTFESFRVLDKALLEKFEHEKLKDQIILGHLQAEIIEHQRRLSNAPSAQIASA
jgi:hypothetical protein